jgi:hypothetical protein
MPNCCDAEFLERLVRQTRKNFSSISFSRNPASYFLRPRLRSQPPISISWAPSLPAGRHHRPYTTTCLGRRVIVLFWRVMKGCHGGDPELAAILVADVIGFSRLAGFDEERTLARLRAFRGDLIDHTIALHHGRIVR